MFRIEFNFVNEEILLRKIPMQICPSIGELISILLPPHYFIGHKTRDH